MRAMEENTAARKNSAPNDFLRTIAEPWPSVLASAAQARRSLALHRIVAVVCCASNGPRRQPDASRSLETRARACQIGQTRADLSSFAAAERGGSRLTDHRNRTCAVHSGTRRGAIPSNDRVK